MSAFAGKQVAGHIYVHSSAIASLPNSDVQRIERAEAIAAVVRGVDYNVVKLARTGETLSLLYYMDFFDTAFPELVASWTVDLACASVARRRYDESLNPPILHRKELLLAPGHPRFSEYAALTTAAEAIGLFRDPTRIGFRNSWQALVAERGYRVVDHQLVPIANVEGDAEADAVFIDADGASADVAVLRHRTALSRYTLSAPVQCLARHGYLDGQRSFFDYGCGRGDDLRALQALGIPAAGWDPYYAPDAERYRADVVNLGFVINVIEDPRERTDALRGALALTRHVLAVAAMLTNSESSAGVPYADGVLTQRRTFQKYYSQTELRDYIAQTSGKVPIVVAPGVLFVFADDDEEQRFLASRQRNRRALTVALRDQARKHKAQRRAEISAERQTLLNGLLARWLELAREPDASEVENATVLVAEFGSFNRALGAVKSLLVAESLPQLARRRMDDLAVHFALLEFEHTRRYRALEPGLQRDVKAFFGDQRQARDYARALLLKVADPAQIDAACVVAAEQGLGWLNPGHSLQLHSSLVIRLPAVLRVYVACATLLYGDVSSVDLVKIHIRSGKVSLLRYDDFTGAPLPRLAERAKVRLRDLDIDYFFYGPDIATQLLYLKSRYLNEEVPGYAEQLAFDQALLKLDAFDFSEHGPPAEAFYVRLAELRWEVADGRLLRSLTLPPLDARCGMHLTYRDLVECGETWERTRCDNLPRAPDSYSALADLARLVLDPVIEYFGSIRLTYGFCSAKLAREIPGRIAPTLDQHAAHEVNRRGQPVCARLGAAVDFIVEDENMLDVARWIVENTPFDRLYYYGRDRPLHVSIGPQAARVVVAMVEVNGQRMPRPLKFA